jgi:hypothetical protein
MKKKYIFCYHFKGHTGKKQDPERNRSVKKYGSAYSDPYQDVTDPEH